MPATVDVIDAISTPPLASLQQVLDLSGPYGPGSHTLSDFTTNGAFLLPAGTYPVSGTYGVIVQPTGVFPPGAGFTIGFNDGTLAGDPSGDQYELRICQIVLLHQLPITGAWVVTEAHNIFGLNQMFLWPALLGSPARLGLFVNPLWSIDLFYMCVL